MVIWFTVIVNKIIKHYYRINSLIQNLFSSNLFPYHVEGPRVLVLAFLTDSYMNDVTEEMGSLGSYIITVINTILYYIY